MASNRFFSLGVGVDAASGLHSVERVDKSERLGRTSPRRLFFSSGPLLAHATEATCGARLDGIHLLSTYGVHANVV